MPHPELALEQRHLDRATECRDRGHGGPNEPGARGGGLAAAESDSEVARWHLRRRLDSLADPAGVPAFGRIDEGDDRWYVGRRHIEDDTGEPLVVDWRAPVSIPFYRATVHDPMGLDIRRRFTSEGAELIDILEEDFNDPDGSAVSGGIPDPLLAELDRERTGSMRDIVATIATEQDEVIRTPLDRLLIVQGGPGTGKTAVALHRAAYLLFEHRMELMDTGVLVIGPNPGLLALRRRRAAQPGRDRGPPDHHRGTAPRVRPAGRRDDPPAVARLKGDGRMAAVIDGPRCDRRSGSPPSRCRSAPPGARCACDPSSVARAVDDIFGREVPHATGKESLRNQLLHDAYEIHERTAEVPALKANFVAAARSDDGFRRIVDRIWPNLGAAATVQRLSGSSTVRRRAARGILERDEIERLGRAVAKRISDERWSPADVALIDEAESRISGVRVTYGHIVVDEAQDLSTMALRMLRRRAAGGSMTIVGDLAQGTRAWATRSWEEVEAAVVQTKAPLHFAELTVGYRTPAPILDLANRLLPVAAPDVTPARSIRHTGAEPEIHGVAEVSGCCGRTRHDGPPRSGGPWR